MVSQVDDYQIRIVDTCDYAKQFGEIFFDRFDKSRHTIERLFHQQATLLWNGNECNGCESIASFFKKLPPCRTTLLSVDGQPVLDLPFLNNQQMILILCCGKMKFEGREPENFTDSFTLVADNGPGGKVWKIFNQTHRSQ